MDADLNQRVRELIIADDEIGAIKLLRKEEGLSLHEAHERVSALSRELTGPEPQDAAYIVTHIGAFVLMCVVGLSGFLFLHSAKHLFDYWHSAEWPTTTGIVTLSMPDNTMAGGLATGPRVEYEYSVDGVDYHSNDWGFSLIDAGPGSNTQGVLARYPAGAEVTVHYDPEQPQRALLDTSLQGPWIRLMAFVIGLPLYLWFRRFARRVEIRSRQKMRDAGAAASR